MEQITSFNDLVGDINLSEFDAFTGGLAKGDYKAVVKESKLTEGKFGPQWEITFEVLEGPSAGQTHKEFLTLPTKGNPATWSRTPQVGDNGRSFNEYDSNVTRVRRMVTFYEYFGVPKEQRNSVTDVAVFQGIVGAMRIYINKNTDRSSLGQFKKIDVAAEQAQQVAQMQQATAPQNYGGPVQNTPTTSGNPFAAH